MRYFAHVTEAFVPVSSSSFELKQCLAIAPHVAVVASVLCKDKACSFLIAISTPVPVPVL